MRFPLTLFILLHAAIHAMGFAKWLHLAPVPQLSGRTLISLSVSASRWFGLLWLIAGLLLVAAALTYALRHDGWWWAGLVGVLLSQVLIVIAWPDAKWGTLANVIILLAAMAAAAQTRFSVAIDHEIRALLATGATDPAPQQPVTEAQLARLPAPVQRWLTRSGVVGRAAARSVRLKQVGQLRTSPTGPWLPAQADQYFRLTDPGFVWRVRSRMYGVPIAGRDRYDASGGEMLIKAASLVDVVKANDYNIALGAQLRYLAEIMWFPSAALSPLLQWESVDEASAKVTLRHGGRSVNAVIYFDPLGRITGLLAQRHLGGGADAKLTPWAGRCSAWREFDGIEVPSTGEVSWKLDSGDFPYYRWEITALQFDRNSLWDSTTP